MSRGGPTAKLWEDPRRSGEGWGGPAPAGTGQAEALFAADTGAAPDAPPGGGPAAPAPDAGAAPGARPAAFAPEAGPDPLPTLPAKRILSPRQKDGWLGSDYTINLYRGCSHGCIYCDSRSACYGIEDFGTVHAKENALCLLEADLRRTRRTGMVLTGAMSDPYNPREPAARLTHGALGLLARYGFGVVAITKSDLVLNDLGLYMRLAEGPGAAVFFTLTSLDEALCRKVEPAAPPPARRLAAMRELTLAGVPCGVLLTPILPFLEDSRENITNILNAAADAGACMAYAGGPGNFGVTQRTGQREYFHARLDEAFPGMAAKYRAAFGGRYFCPCPNARALEDAFREACRRRGLVSSMQGIAARVRGMQPVQLSF